MEYTIRKVAFTEDRLIQNIKEMLLFLRKDYPDFSNWFDTKVKTGLEPEARKIYIASPVTDLNQIAGIMILKNTSEEKKICTLCVLAPDQRQGIGRCFLQLAISVLQTPRPLITVSDDQKPAFDPLLRAFGFVCKQSYFGYYRDGVCEHSYNGALQEQRHRRVAYG